MQFSQGFPPLAQTDARILVLGSMPGVASLDAKQYYAFPRNVFWRIMGELFDAGPELDYHSRTKVLAANHIALWDVIKTCQRSGSLDSAIASEGMISNDFGRFFARHRAITHVYFNGLKAAELFRKNVLPKLEDNHVYLTLPSTSPANAASRYTDKLEAWSIIRNACPARSRHPEY